MTLGESGKTIALASGASQTGFGRTGTVDWQTSSIKTATFTAVNGEGYFCNTAGGAFTCNLPAGAAGSIVSIQDYNNTFDTHALTVLPNGSEKINGGAGAIALTTEGQGLTLVYVDATVGWRAIEEQSYATAGSTFIAATGGTITTSGNDKIHTFTGPGTFTVTSAAICAANNVVSHLVIAGGGGGSGGSGGEGGGGGGAGGFREVKSPVTPYTASPLDGYPSAPNRITVSATAYPITVGAGGAGGTYTAGPVFCGTTESGKDGSGSTFSTITSTAGGGGGNGHVSPNPATGRPGGSGGGGGSYSGAAGAGNTPPVSPAQGFNGGPGGPGSPGYAAGGGGGATAVGGCGTSTTGGGGGAGATSSINATPTVRAGGGGGGSHSAGNPGAAGPGGGGAGGDGGAGTAGTINTGGGAGGGGGTAAGGLGGSGVVIIRYKYQ